jgi:hypothetical protein
LKQRKDGMLFRPEKKTKNSPRKTRGCWAFGPTKEEKAPARRGAFGLFFMTYAVVLLRGLRLLF